MATKTQEHTIGSNTYVVTQLGALQGRAVLLVLTRIISPVVAGLIKGDGSSAPVAKSIKKTDDPLALFELWSNNIAAALEAWSVHASEKDLAFLCDAFAERTKIRVTTTHTSAPTIDLELSKSFDTHFAGAYGEMIAWLAFCIRFNFESFLSEIGREIKGSLGGLGIEKKESH